MEPAFSTPLPVFAFTVESYALLKNGHLTVFLEQKFAESKLNGYICTPKSWPNGCFYRIDYDY